MGSARMIFNFIFLFGLVMVTYLLSHADARRLEMSKAGGGNGNGGQVVKSSKTEARVNLGEMKNLPPLGIPFAPPMPEIPFAPPIPEIPGVVWQIPPIPFPHPIPQIPKIPPFPFPTPIPQIPYVPGIPPLPTMPMFPPFHIPDIPFLTPPPA